ncbi:MAG: hypothetical protein AAB303_03805 [Chloroflexota bacterium]
MNAKEQQRGMVLNEVERGELTARQAAELWASPCDKCADSWQHTARRGLLP